MANQAALDIYGQAIPRQFDTFMQGNQNAQAALLGGMPQIYGIDYNTDFAQTPMPEWQQAPTQEQMQPQPQQQGWGGQFPGPFAGQGGEYTGQQFDPSALLAGFRG